MDILFIILKILGFGLIVLSCVGVTYQLIFREDIPEECIVHQENRKKFRPSLFGLLSPAILGTVVLIASVVFSNLV